MNMTLKQIGAQIREDFCAGRFAYHDSTRQVEFRIDGLTVRCERTIDAVNEVARKFERGLPHGGRTPGSVKPVVPRSKGRFRPSAEAFLAFWEDGERDNAMEYLRQWPREEWPRKVESLLREVGV